MFQNKGVAISKLIINASCTLLKGAAAEALPKVVHPGLQQNIPGCISGSHASSCCEAQELCQNESCLPSILHPLSFGCGHQVVWMPGKTLGSLLALTELQAGLGDSGLIKSRHIDIECHEAKISSI